jgi:hypothetical protein
MRSVGSGRFQPEELRLTQNKPARDDLRDPRLAGIQQRSEY